jgi:hypothetical protein
MTNEHLIKMRLGSSTKEMDEAVTYLRRTARIAGAKSQYNCTPSMIVIFGSRLSWGRYECGVISAVRLTI